MKTIQMNTAIKYFCKEAAIRCAGFKARPCYSVYLTLCIEGLAFQAGYYITN